MAGRRAFLAVVAVGVMVAVLAPLWRSRGRVARPPASDRLAGLPPVLLWAWERPEDLGFIDPQTTGVAFLAKVLHPHDDTVTVRRRAQPLRTPPGTVMVAVARIEAATERLTDEQAALVVGEISDMTRLPGVHAVQVDFDARVSQRAWYARVLGAIRQRLPASIGLSITGLASWCVFDAWVEGLPVDEVVPMVFRMGPEARQVRAQVAADGGFRVPLCQHAVGIASDEALPSTPRAQRVYIFHPNTPWTEADAWSVMTRTQ